MNNIIVSPKHKSHELMHEELKKAQVKVKMGGVYSHYKYPDNTYRVINFGFREATDEICVVYQATYDEELIFIRELASWLATVVKDGKKMPRFKLVSI